MLGRGRASRSKARKLLGSWDMERVTQIAVAATNGSDASVLKQTLHGVSHFPFSNVHDQI